MLRFESKFYIVFLTSIISVLLVFNIFTIVTSMNVFSFIPLILQIPIIYLIIKREKPLKLLIKIWSILLLVGGIAGWVNILANLFLRNMGSEFNQDTLSILNMIHYGIQLLGSIYFLMFLNESIAEVDEEVNSKVNIESTQEVSV